MSSSTVVTLTINDSNDTVSKDFPLELMRVFSVVEDIIDIEQNPSTYIINIPTFSNDLTSVDGANALDFLHDFVICIENKQDGLSDRFKQVLSLIVHEKKYEPVCIRTVSYFCYIADFLGCNPDTRFYITNFVMQNTSFDSTVLKILPDFTFKDVLKETSRFSLPVCKVTNKFQPENEDLHSFVCTYKTANKIFHPYMIMFIENQIKCWKWNIVDIVENFKTDDSVLELCAKYINEYKQSYICNL